MRVLPTGHLEHLYYGRKIKINKDTIEVKKGSTVESGSLLGYLGTIPCEKSDLSHLHFEIIYNGENVEPLELMGK